ncbi:MAG: S8 family serine peptidase, partial [Moorea sp. SIO2B7]|nr:S8 family serine peptidase [Moorena sp. SIO2B7]
MTLDDDLTKAVQSDAVNPDVAQQNLGLILQRGGEELALVKVSDRFTVCFTGEMQELPESIEAIAKAQIPYTTSGESSIYMEEVTVEAEKLEAAMVLARESENTTFASHVYQVQDNRETFVYLANQLTIQFSPSIEEDIKEAIAAQFNLKHLKPVQGIPNTFVYQLTKESSENPLKIANRLTKKPEVVTAEANIILRQECFYHPTDSFYPQQWYLANKGGSQLGINSHIDAEKAWDISRGVRSVVVAIIDDDIDINHPDFQGEGKIVAPRDFKERNFLPLPESDQESHGTACAGIAVAEENGTGVVGVAPGCALMPLRDTGFLDDQSIEELFEWVIEKGASVISCSWAASAVRFPLSLRQNAAINRAATEGRKGKGCVIVFAAGNSNRPINGTIYERGWRENIINGPTQWLNGFAIHPDVIAVSACTSLNKKSVYSNWGTN